MAYGYTLAASNEGGKPSGYEDVVCVDRSGFCGCGSGELVGKVFVCGSDGLGGRGSCGFLGGWGPVGVAPKADPLVPNPGDLHETPGVLPFGIRPASATRQPECDGN